jgi:thymidylate synthase (FAD)
MKAEYITHSGNDLLVADSARVSFDKRAELYTPEQNAKLITYLAKHGHWTPFSHPQITIRETVPIFVARQR